MHVTSLCMGVSVAYFSRVCTNPCQHGDIFNLKKLRLHIQSAQNRSPEKISNIIETYKKYSMPHVGDILKINIHCLGNNMYFSIRQT